MASIDPLPLPFAAWSEGLLALADALPDPDRERIVVARLEATAVKLGASLKQICSLALLVPSRARFDRQTFHRFEADPRAVAMGEKLGHNEAFSAHMDQLLDAHETLEELREEAVFAAFPEQDPRRILKDTVIGLAAAQLADVSQRLGEADPFSRLARRISLWFKASHDHSRYGLQQPWDGRAVAGAAKRMLDSLAGDDARRIGRLIDIWAGNVTVEASPEGIRQVASPLFPFRAESNRGLVSILTLEVYGALLDEIEKLDTETSEALLDTMKPIHHSLDDGRPSTAIFSTWIATWFKDTERFRLAYDPSEAFRSAMYSDLNAPALESLLTETLSAMTQRGHPLFAAGPLPLRGVIFNRESALHDKLEELAPEAADLFRLLGLDGDYADSNGPLSSQCYWTGDLDPNALMVPEAIDRAGERGDHALADMLIGYWMLYCALFEQAPLPDLSGLAQRINKLPTDHRSSTNAALGFLKRESAENSRLRRDMDALLSWLPVVDIAPAEDVEAFLQGLFSGRLWSLLSANERQRLIEAEETFLRLRRLPPQMRERERIRLTVVDWSAVAEAVLRHVRIGLAESANFDSGRPLGTLLGDVRGRLKAFSKDANWQDRPRISLARNALDVLESLNKLNIRGGKHMGGAPIAWEDVVYVHAGLYWALRALLDTGNVAVEKSR